jgi:hypothetical protein
VFPQCWLEFISGACVPLFLKVENSLLAVVTIISSSSSSSSSAGTSAITTGTISNAQSPTLPPPHTLHNTHQHHTVVFALQVATIILQRNGPNELFELCASFCLAITTFYVRVGLKSKVLLPVSQPLHTSQFCSAILLFRKATLFMSLLKREAKAAPAHDGSNRARLSNFIKTSGRKLENALGAVKWYDEILALLKLLNDVPDGALATSGFCPACGDARTEF